MGVLYNFEKNSKLMAYVYKKINNLAKSHFCLYKKRQLDRLLFIPTIMLRLFRLEHSLK